VYLKNACAGLMPHFAVGKERFWGVVGNSAKMATQYTAKWGVQNGAMIF